jgi:hypothetical protein
MTYYYTYKITCLKGSLKDHYYYGQHTTKIKNDNYIGSGSMLRSYFKKYEKIEGETYIKEILAYYNSKEELDNAEIELICDKYKTDPMCLNLIKGGRQSSIDEAAHKRMSDKAKKRISPMKGKHHSEKSKKLMSIERKGKTHPSYTGWNHTEEAKENIRNGQLNRIYVHKDNINKRIYENELNEYILNGWLIGRGIFPIKDIESRNNNLSESSKNHHWINNGIIQTHVHEDKIEQYLNEGWLLGQLKKERHNNNFPSHKNQTWYFDPTLNKRVWVDKNITD